MWFVKTTGHPGVYLNVRKATNFSPVEQVSELCWRCGGVVSEFGNFYLHFNIKKHNSDLQSLTYFTNL